MAINSDIQLTTITPELLRNHDVIDLLEKYKNDPKKLEDPALYETITQALIEIHSNNDIELDKPLSDYIHEAFFRIETYKLRDDSPFKILDNPQTMLLRNGLFTIGAKANTGKTSLATHLAIEIMKANSNTCFIFFTLDDSRVLGVKRILSQITKENYMRTQPEEENANTKTLINDFLRHIFIKDEGSTLEKIKPTIERIKRKGSYKNVIVCIDYLQLLESRSSRNGDKRTSLNEILKEIKQIQKDTKTFFMILSQMKRDGNGKDFEYRETSEIENVSDVCIDLTYIDDAEESKILPDRTVKISKNKIGVKGQKYKTKINECFLFSELEYVNHSTFKKTPKNPKSANGSTNKWDVIEDFK